MGFVLVPVPEEHVMAVMRFVVREFGRGSNEPWNAEAVAELWEDSDAPSRMLLAQLAAAALAAGELEAGDAADRIGVSVRELAAIINELNSVARETSRPNLVTARLAFVSLADGSSVETRMLCMQSELGALVRAAEQQRPLTASDASNG